MLRIMVSDLIKKKIFRFWQYNQDRIYSALRVHSRKGLSSVINNQQKVDKTPSMVKINILKCPPIFSPSLTTNTPLLLPSAKKRTKFNCWKKVISGLLFKGEIWLSWFFKKSSLIIILMNNWLKNRLLCFSLTHIRWKIICKFFSVKKNMRWKSQSFQKLKWKNSF